MYRSLNPTTGELIEEFALHTDAHVESSLEAAAAEFQVWRRARLGDRTEVLERAARELDAARDALAELMAEEMGKPVVQGLAEVDKCVWVCRYYAENAEAFLAPRAAESDGAEAWVRYDPLGTILAIMPWNFPLWQVFRAAAPALAAGNTVVLKHAPNTPRCALRIAELFEAAGTPQSVFTNLFLDNNQAAAAIGHSTVRGVTLTGSSRAGSEVARRAGAALKPIVLELGGSDPFIVFDDADIPAAVEAGVASRLLNNGQSCIAAKRFLVQAAVADEFTERFATRMVAQSVGDPRLDTTQVGPLARADLRSTLAAQVDASVAAGTEVVVEGGSGDGPGFFYKPTVLRGAPADSPAGAEELFGPVAVIELLGSDEEAVEQANRTRYGLGASMWTADRARVDELIPRIDAGSVFVNGMVKSDPRLPFGGVKDSGFGRELARDGVLEFVNTKTVWMR
ncbi:MAG: aldehyde dehydrogenase family protein [Acidobacteria bacterium]|nr:aldehyde dehydrogenase family protein [Acidobacteriota bacterium]